MQSTFFADEVRELFGRNNSVTMEKRRRDGSLVRGDTEGLAVDISALSGVREAPLREGVNLNQ